MPTKPKFSCGESLASAAFVAFLSRPKNPFHNKQLVVLDVNDSPKVNTLAQQLYILSQGDFIYRDTPLTGEKLSHAFVDTENSPDFEPQYRVPHGILAPEFRSIRWHRS